MQAKYLGIIIVVLSIAVGGYFLLRGSSQTPVSTLAPTPEIPSATQLPTPGITEISVVGTEFSFSPASISLKAGEKVKITFKNSGQAIHNLVIEGLRIGTKTITAGQTETLEFTAPASGTYSFFCSVPGHRVAGMEGNLTIE